MRLHWTGIEIIIYNDWGGGRGGGYWPINTPPQLGRAALPPRGHQSARSIRENMKDKSHQQGKYINK